MDLFNMSHIWCKMTAGSDPPYAHVMASWQKYHVIWQTYYFLTGISFSLYRLLWIVHGSMASKLKSEHFIVCSFDRMSQIFDFRPYFWVKALGGTWGRIQGMLDRKRLWTSARNGCPEYVLVSHQTLLLKNKDENRKSGSCDRKGMQQVFRF